MTHLSEWEKELIKRENRLISDMIDNINNTIYNRREKKELEFKQSMGKTFIQLTFNF